MNNLKRFTEAQYRDYEQALKEIKNGRKESHWMWYIFPQLSGLGHSQTARYYAIRDRAEAEAYLAHPVLGKRLLEISSELLKLESSDATAVMGWPDDLKLKSSMTLFSRMPAPVKIIIHSSMAAPNPTMPGNRSRSATFPPPPAA